MIINLVVIKKIQGDTFNVYKRGIGNINVVFNMQEISEKETVCRSLYQYIQDIPSLLWHYSGDIIRSLEHLFVSPIYQSEDLYMIIGAIMNDVIAIYLKFSSYSFDDINSHQLHEKSVNNMTEKSLNYLEKSLKRLKDKENIDTDVSTDTGVVLIIIDNINDILKTRHNNKKKNIYKSNDFLFSIDVELICGCIILLRDAAVSYVQKRFIDQNIPEDEDDIKVTYMYLHIYINIYLYT